MVIVQICNNDQASRPISIIIIIITMVIFIIINTIIIIIIINTIIIIVIINTIIIREAILQEKCSFLKMLNLD